MWRNTDECYLAFVFYIAKKYNQRGIRMAKKKVHGDYIQFVGESSNDVTGSEYLINYNNKQILIECGLYQSSNNSYLDSYNINSRKFQYKPSEISYVFACHAHIDHIGKLPRLVKEGFCGKIIATKDTAMIMKALLLNSAHIIREEANSLSKKYKRKYKPIYDTEDVLKTMDLVYEYDDYNFIYQLDDVVSFQWFNNSHCLGASQLQLILHSAMSTRRVLYTSDIGSLCTDNHFVVDTEIPTMHSDVCIMESTYGNRKQSSKKDRDFDLCHLRGAIETTLGRNGSVILPCFSFSRTQEILTNIFMLYAENKNFKAPVIVDSVLSCEICNIYSNILRNEDLLLWKRVLSWNNLKLVTDKDESLRIIRDKTPKIVIASSGFCTNGRVVNYLKEYLKDQNSMIVFTGYVGDNPSYLSYRIKNGSDNSRININGHYIQNKADCITLSSFSNHANHKDLVKYGSSLKTNKLILVHGTEDSKNCLREDLKVAISNNDKTYKVVCASKDMTVRL